MSKPDGKKSGFFMLFPSKKPFKVFQEIFGYDVFFA
jgi:hypothetical protein